MSTGFSKGKTQEVFGNIPKEKEIDKKVNLYFQRY